MPYPKFLPLREIGSSGWLDRNLSQNSGAGLTGHPSVHAIPSLWPTFWAAQTMDGTGPYAVFFRAGIDQIEITGDILYFDLTTPSLENI